MKKMRWLLAWLVLFCLGLTNAYGQQFWEGSVYNDTLATMVPGVVNFDWSSSGSGVAEGLAPAGSPLVVGQEFTMRYQSYLVKLEDVAGQPINFPGLNTAFEYTVVAEIPQKIAAFIPGTTQISVFSTLPGGRFFIYHDSEPNNNVLSGLGFDDGDLVASGVIDAGVATSLTYISATNQAIGSTTLTGAVSYANPQFIDPALNIVSLRLETTVNFPPLESTTTNFFVSRPGEGNLDPYAVQTDDLLLKLDASSKFLVQDACIELIKEVSVDGGTNWYDANTLEEAPGTTNGALYRFTVTNCGSTDLTGVVISDPTLGLDGLVVGDLPAGESRTVNYSLDFPNSLLSNPGLCDDVPPPGDGDPNKYNEATVVGTIADTDLTVTDSDPAWVKCICLDIEKLVSVDGGMTFEDADQCFDPAAPVAAGAVEYQLVVTNCGSVTLDDLTVTDALLGVNEYVNGLEPGSSQTWTGTELPEALYVDDFCAVFGEKLDANRNLLNTAVASATALGQYTLRDEDSACVSCLCSGTIGDFVWDDLDRDGIQDAGEPGIAGVSVTLSGNGIEPVTVQTATDGSYLFTDLCAGTYTVTVTTPDGYTATMPNAPGSTAANDSNGSPATVTLTTDNSSDLTIDFGFYTPCTGSIGDYVWNDIDQDGIQDAPLETGIAGVTVNLLQGGAVIGTTMTDSNGFYLFSDLCAGTYAVTVATPDGYTASPSLQGGDTAMDSNGSPATVTLTTDNSSDQTIDFGFHLQDAKIGDYVWLDKDRDGIQDADEDGLSGVTVNLLDCAGAAVATTLTDLDGFYEFIVAPGEYKVQFVLPSGYAYSPLDQGGNDAADSDAGAEGMTICTTLEPGENDPTWDAGMYPMPGSIGDYVWNDLNKDGVQDAGETGISGVTVNLIDCTTNELVATTTTDANGLYSFTGLMPGSYRVEFVAPMGYDFTTPNVGNDAFDSDANASGVTECITLNAGESNTTVDAGLYLPCTGSIGDYVWNDADKDGIQDAGEAGIAGVTVKLLMDGKTVATTMTDANGAYLFTELCPGTYTVEVVAPAGYLPTPVCSNDSTVEGDANCSPQTVVSNNDSNTTIDFGFYLMPASIGDYVWNDVNQNGVQDAGEMGIAGVKVELYTCADVLVATTYTNADGYYVFTNLMPGDYYVKFYVKDGYDFTMPNQGSDDTKDSDADPATGKTVCTTLVAGENDMTWDAGMYTVACTPLGTGTPGYWMNHPEAWPVDSITIGGVVYSKDKAILLMKSPVKLDKTYTMFPALVSAKLNVLVCNDASCIADTIQAADDWMRVYGPVGSGVLASSSAWAIGEPLYLLLDEYNNGLLCAPSRDVLEVEYDDHKSSSTKTVSYWVDTSKTWPSKEVKIGGKTYDKATAISCMKGSKTKDGSYVMYRALAAAKLNALEGNDVSCISDTIKAADEWMYKYGPCGKGVAPGSWAWKTGEPIWQKLDDYNNGKLAVVYKKDRGTSYVTYDFYSWHDDDDDDD